MLDPTARRRSRRWPPLVLTTFWVDNENKNDAVDRGFCFGTSSRAPAANTAGRARHVRTLGAGVQNINTQPSTISQSTWYVVFTSNAVIALSDFAQESPHEHQQNVLLSRIITNVVR